MKLVIVIPAYNEERVIGRVLDSLPKRLVGISKIVAVVVNDGSSDRTEREVKKRSVKLINHIINRGLGAALGTGLEYAKGANADVVVTFDADGQHDPKDIAKVIQPILSKKADFVIGSRTKDKGMPPLRKIVNWGGNIVTYLMFGILTSDSQSGLRALSKKAVTKMKIQMNRMEVASEFIKEAAQNRLRIREVPIKAIYTDYSRVKGQQISNSFNIFIKLILDSFSGLR